MLRRYVPAPQIVNNCLGALLTIHYEGRPGLVSPPLGLRATMTRMGWQTTGDVAEFLDAAGEYLSRERARNTVILTVSEQLRVNRARYSWPAGPNESQGPASRPLFGWWTDQAGAAGGAFLHTPPHPLLLTAVPAAIAGVTRQVAGMLRVGPVYTPPELRGRGYASAVTAAVSLRAREAGAEEVLLYTDLANSTSNSIYQRIGYRPVEDRVVLAFSAA